MAVNFIASSTTEEPYIVRVSLPDAFIKESSEYHHMITINSFNINNNFRNLYIINEEGEYKLCDTFRVYYKLGTVDQTYWDITISEFANYSLKTLLDSMMREAKAIIDNAGLEAFDMKYEIDEIEGKVIFTYEAVRAVQFYTLDFSDLNCLPPHYSVGNIIGFIDERQAIIDDRFISSSPTNSMFVNKSILFATNLKLVSSTNLQLSRMVSPKSQTKQRDVLYMYNAGTFSNYANKQVELPKPIKFIINDERIKEFYIKLVDVCYNDLIPVDNSALISINFSLEVV
jgi:hypothetical protein